MFVVYFEVTVDCDDGQVAVEEGGEVTRGRSHSAELRFLSTIGKGVGVTMGDDKASPSRPAGSDRELLMAGHSDDIEDPPKLGQPPPSAYHSGREVRCVLCF